MQSTEEQAMDLPSSTQTELRKRLAQASRVRCIKYSKSHSTVKRKEKGRNSPSHSQKLDLMQHIGKFSPCSELKHRLLDWTKPKFSLIKM